MYVEDLFNDLIDTVRWANGLCGGVFSDFLERASSPGSLHVTDLDELLDIARQAANECEYAQDVLLRLEDLKEIYRAVYDVAESTIGVRELFDPLSELSEALNEFDFPRVRRVAENIVLNVLPRLELDNKIDEPTADIIRSLIIDILG